MAGVGFADSSAVDSGAPCADSSAVRIGICGVSGRVGKLLVEILGTDAFAARAVLSAVFDRVESSSGAYAGALIAKNFEELLGACDVVIDFSAPSATLGLLESALLTRSKTALVIGTTGLDSATMGLLSKVAEFAPVLHATNMSRGVAVLNRIAEIVAKALPQSNIEIVEIHHRMKKDAPSGTALTLAKHCAQARGLDIEAVRVSGRDGIIGARSESEIAVMSLRGGDIVGRHTAGFYLDGEFIELTHNATNRATFAYGALNAALFLRSQKPGIYTIYDALGL